MRLTQQHMGLPVLLRGAGVALGSEGKGRLVAFRLERRLPASVTPSLSAEAAADMASALIGLRAIATDARLAIYPTPTGGSLTWVVYPTRWIAGFPYAPVVILDAHTGARIAGWNAAVGLNAAKIYEFNPIKTPTLIEVTLPVGAGQTQLENPRIRALNCVDKQDTTLKAGIQMHLCHIEPKATADAQGDFGYAPAADTAPEDEFAEVSLFYHANKAYELFAALGMTDLATKPLPAITNLMLPQTLSTVPPDPAKLTDPSLPFEPYSNAFFAPATPFPPLGLFGVTGPGMWFGQGVKRDFSYDGDVVYHELTHAAVDHTIGLISGLHADEQGLIDAPGALNEALADYFSSVITGDPELGEYAALELGGDEFVRSIQNESSCPAGLSGEPHFDSSFVAGGLWTARSILAPAERPELDQAVFDAMMLSPSGDIGFEDFLALVVATLKTSPLGQAAAGAFEAEMKKRGVLPSCRRVLESTGEPMGTEDTGSGGGFRAPGAAQAPAMAPYAPGVVQFHVSTPAETRWLTVRLESAAPTSIEPRILVGWGPEPIRFDYEPAFSTTASSEQKALKTASGFSATLAVPPGTTDAFVMIANSGMEGAYKAVRFELAKGTGSQDAGLDAETVDAPSAAHESPGPSDPSCQCGSPGTRGRSPASNIAALSLAAAIALSRRPRRRPA